jgi:hypothetical protein
VDRVTASRKLSLHRLDPVNVSSTMSILNHYYKFAVAVIDISSISFMLNPNVYITVAREPDPADAHDLFLVSPSPIG